jgi:hypothetical protein
MFSEKIHIHVSLGSIVNTQACCVNIFACEHLAQIILRPLSVLSVDNFHNFLINFLNKENNFYERMKTMGLIAGSALEQKNKWVFYFWSLPHT